MVLRLFFVIIDLCLFLAGGTLKKRKKQFLGFGSLLVVVSALLFMILTVAT